MLKRLIEKIQLFFFELTDVVSSMKALQKDILANLDE